MQKIDDLRLEIFSFEDESVSLQQELAAAGDRTLKLAIVLETITQALTEAARRCWLTIAVSVKLFFGGNFWR